MELRIRDSSNIVDVSFGNWLINNILRYRLISNIHKYNFENWDKFLTESDSIKRLYKKKYYTKDVIVFAANNLTCKGAPGEITIQFDSTKFIPGFDRLRLDVIVKTIDYGTLDIPSCPIFRKTLKYLADDIDTYVGLYYEV